jgi:hypothetical protein
MSKVAFTGGSITSGDGFNLPAEEKFMWVNLVHKNIFPTSEFINAGITGASNTAIFQETVNIIASNDDLTHLFCSWVAGPRYTIHAGFELHDTRLPFISRSQFGDVFLSTGTIPKQYIESIRDRFLALHHYHNEIKMVVTYSNIINMLCWQKNIVVYHINDSCLWDKDYFVQLHNTTPDNYTPFTKSSILNVHNRSDDVIFKLYEKMHDEYAQAGGVQDKLWINLYEPFKDNSVDKNGDGLHPGVKSNYNYYVTVKNFLESTTI